MPQPSEAEDSWVPLVDLVTADLTVDTVYLGGREAKDDGLHRLLGVGVQGGFRKKKASTKGLAYVALYTSGEEPDWPDLLDTQTGIFTYYGDNRKSGKDMHDTHNGGNSLLRDVFAMSHGSPADRAMAPPFLLFEKYPEGRSFRFRGLLAPGAATVSQDDELATVWRTGKNGLRFQNYRAIFTVLDTSPISRLWIDELTGTGNKIGDYCPTPWRAWVDARAYKPLLAKNVLKARSVSDQIPSDPHGKAILKTIRDYFEKKTDFEECAVELWRMQAPATGECTVTPPTSDHGRDAIGVYHLGPQADRISIDFALEAKCWAENGVRAKDVSRLIARLRYRHFGVFVTTSYFNRNVYKEIHEDSHPVVLMCGKDIVDILKQNGYGDLVAVKAWLQARYPNP